MPDPLPSYRAPPKPGRKPPFRALAILASTLLAGLALWLILDGRSGRVPLVEADPRPVRTRPADPGGLRMANQDALIYDGEALPEAHASLSPEPEEPRLDLLRRLTTRSPEAAVPVKPGDAPATAVTAPTPDGAPPPPAASPAEGVEVQIAALPSASAARKEWDRLAHRAPALLGHHKPKVERFSRSGQAPLFRLRTGPFQDATAARGFCHALKAAGGDCFVVRG
ncbi:MAG TPA: SPOR domain-containing protein [Roseomonas sp.]